MKHGKRSKCPMGPADVVICVRPREREPERPKERREPVMTITRTEKRSWFTIAITGFGALLVRYFRIITEHGRRFRLF